MRKRFLVGALLGFLVVALSGCFLRSLFSRVVVFSDVGECIHEVFATISSTPRHRRASQPRLPASLTIRQGG